MNSKTRTKLEAVLKFLSKARNKKFMIAVLIITGIFVTPFKCSVGKYTFEKESILKDLFKAKELKSNEGGSLN